MNTLLLFEKELCHAGVVTASGEPGVRDEPGPVHVPATFGRSSMKQMHIVRQLECHVIVYAPMDEFDNSGIAPENGEKGAFVAVEHSIPASRQHILSSLRL